MINYECRIQNHHGCFMNNITECVQTQLPINSVKEILETQGILVEKNVPETQIRKLFDYLHSTPLPKDENGNEIKIRLSSISKRDSVWDTHRCNTKIVGHIYDHNPKYAKYAERIHNCSGWLKFGCNENGFVLKQAFFCHVRLCPMCQWRKSLYWKAMMYKNLDKVRENYPTHRWLFLTLTVKNCPITELRATISDMNKSWQRLLKRKEFLGVIDGWARATEVTRDKKNPNTHAHPHFHCILMVKPSYFGKAYIKQQEWAELWRDCLGVDYMPMVDIRTVKPKNGSDTSYDYAIKSAIAETLKYSTKPSDMIQDCGNSKSREWFFELTKQVHKLRFMATGGALKNAIKAEKEITNQDMITANPDDEENKTDEKRLGFSFDGEAYVHSQKYNE